MKWVSLIFGIVLIPAFLFVFLSEALKGNIWAIVFLFWMGLALIPATFFYVKHQVFHVPFPFDPKLLESDEQIISDSALHEVVTKLGGIGASISWSYLTITNKRVVIAGSLFGYLTYKYFALSQWFDPSHPGRHHVEVIGLTDDKDGIIFKANIGTMEIYIDDAEKIYSFLTQTQS
jgi:hypothetical protein